MPKIGESLVLHSNQNLAVFVAVAAGKTIAVNVNPCPGGGFVWPHLTANSVPIPGGTLGPHQVRTLLDNITAGKTAAVNFSTGVGRNHIDFT